MKCPLCGANIEVTEFKDGSVLIRQDCLCKITINSPQVGNNDSEPGLNDVMTEEEYITKYYGDEEEKPIKSKESGRKET